MGLFIMTVVTRHDVIRIQMENEDSAMRFTWWCLGRGYLVRCRFGEPVRLTEYEISVGNELVNLYSRREGK